MRKVTIVALALLLLPGISQAKTLEELLVEKGVVSESDLRAGGMAGGSKVYWNKGTRLEFPDNGFTAKLNTQLQPRYTFTDGDDDTSENTSSFTLRRARLQVAGTALNSEFSYKLQAEMASSPELLDAYLVWAPCDENSLQMGQFKTGISRQFNTSSSQLQFPDRSVVSETFDLDRQTGLALHTSMMDGKVALTGQLLNGESDGEGRNQPGTDTDHTYVATARIGLMGELDAHEEGDIGWTEDMAMDFGAAYAFSDKSVGGMDLERHTVSADTNVKSNGMSFHGEFFWADDEETGADSNAVGFYAQAGYFLQPKKLELAVRYAFMDCDDGALGECSDDSLAGGVDDINGVDVSLNYYFWKHNLKAQLGYSLEEKNALDSTEDDIRTNRWIFQVSSYF